jgi:SAM-dependent methyltransferase
VRDSDAAGIVPVERDAFGHEIRDYWRGDRDIVEIIERDDGYVSVSGPVRAYFAPPEDWRPSEHEALAHARGRVLDAGSGAGRHDLCLQGRGLDVTAPDNSPLALGVCGERGCIAVCSSPSLG